MRSLDSDLCVKVSHRLTSTEPADSFSVRMQYASKYLEYALVYGIKKIYQLRRRSVTALDIQTRFCERDVCLQQTMTVDIIVVYLF